MPPHSACMLQAAPKSAETAPASPAVPEPPLPELEPLLPEVPALPELPALEPLAPAAATHEPLLLTIPAPHGSLSPQARPKSALPNKVNLTMFMGPSMLRANQKDMT